MGSADHSETEMSEASHKRHQGWLPFFQQGYLYFADVTMGNAPIWCQVESE